MKTFLLSGVAVLALTSVAMADTAPATGGNTIYLNQQDANNIATITQSGSGNKAGRSETDAVTQSAGLGGSGGNKIDIDQTGNGGLVAATTRYDGRTDTMQRGSGNELTVRQGGADNQFFVSQYGSHPSTLPTGNASTPLDPSLVPASGWNTLIQSGTGNKATVQQGRSDDQASNGFAVTNSGNERNAAFIIRQSGASSTVYVGQTNGSNGVAYVDQSATGSTINFAQGYHEQNAGQGFAGNYNYAEFRQSGSGNNLSPDQNGANLRMFMTQSGSGNLVIGRQSAFSSTMTVNGSGSGSRVYAFQGYTIPQARTPQSTYHDYQVSPPIADFNVSGYSARSQESTIGSSLTVSQTASSSTVGFSQNGIGQIAMLSQGGSNNGMYGLQEGASSTAMMTQSDGGMLNNMFLLQGTATSTDNHATLVQDGGMNNFIYLAQSGSSNQANVGQGIASGNVSNNVQSGNTNTLTVRQNKL